MSLSYYAVSIQADRLFAVQVEPDEVAVLLDAGHLVQLARPVDLVRVAVRHNTTLAVFSRDDVLRSHGRTGRPLGAEVASDDPETADDDRASIAARTTISRLFIRRNRISVQVHDVSPTWSQAAHAST